MIVIPNNYDHNIWVLSLCLWYIGCYYNVMYRKVVPTNVVNRKFTVIHL